MFNQSNLVAQKNVGSMVLLPVKISESTKLNALFSLIFAAVIAQKADEMGPFDKIMLINNNGNTLSSFYQDDFVTYSQRPIITDN